MMVVIGVIILLLALLLPALGLARRNAQLAGSQSNLRQIHTLMTAYSTDNREHIVPSQFDYSNATVKGKVRSPSPAGVNPLLGDPHRGTWTDILWTTGGFSPIRVPGTDYDYRFDSPDQPLFQVMPEFESPFRSKLANTFSAEDSDDPIATPFGDGAQELGEPGYFAANDFFDCRLPDRSFTTGQIKRPTVSIYLVDSAYGETIPMTEEAWCGEAGGSLGCAGHPDFRYVGDKALLLMLDGRVVTQSRWDDLEELVEDYRLRVDDLDK
jgi:type II secretory pathway pseudopilin PulG